MLQFVVRYSFALALVFISCMHVRAQKPAFEAISTPAGIDSYEIADIRQDTQGYLWIATGSGLLRFDGYEWTVYQHDPKNPNSLAGNNIRTVCPTRDGLIWVGGWSSGLDCLDPETGKITHYPIVKRKKYVFEENAISALLEDHLGNLWVGTVGGLYRKEKTTDRFIAYPSVAKDAGTLSYPFVSCIYEDRQGTLWIGTGEQRSNRILDGGLNKLDPKTSRFTRYLHNPADTNSLVENKVLALFEDSRGTFWVGTGGDGLHTLNRKTGDFTRYPFQESHPERLSRPYSREKNLRKFASNLITFIQEDPTGAIWIGTLDAGANRYEPKSGRVTHYNTPTDGLTDYNLYSARRARDGTLWIGTISGHLFKVIIPDSPVQIVKVRSGVHYFEEDSAGTLWVGMISGLVADNPVTKEAHKWLAKVAKQTPLLTDHITRMASDKDGDRWISTWNDGLYRYQRSVARFVHYQHDSLNASSISPGEGTGFYQDRSGTRWIMTGGGLDRLDEQSGKFVHYLHNDQDTTSISNNSILAVVEDHTGAFWVGTNGGGLNLMDRATGKFRHFLPWGVVTQVIEDASGTIWIASSFGLYHFDRKKGTLIPFIDPATGNILSFVKTLVEDNNRNLWVAVSNGLAAISADRKSLRWFSVNYGIPVGEDFFFGGSYKRRDGSLYFGSMERYFHFRPEELLKSRPLPPLLNISSFRVHNQLIEPGSDGRLHLNLPQAKSIKLSYNQNVFSLDFAAIDFRHPELHLYSYKLENYDLEWRPVSAERTANYFNVPPGKFNFRVKAANSDGTWVEKSINIVISPPWWRSGWAYALYVVVLAGLFFGGWRALLYRERAQNELKIRELKAQQLLEMDRLKSDFFTNVSHEFRTPLTLILSPLEKWLADMPDNNPYADQFRSMHRNGRRLLQLVNQMLDLSKLEAGKMQLETRPADLIHFLHRVARSFISLAESRGISFRVAAPEGSLWLNFDTDKLEKILNNLLSNAFKFTPDNGQISLSTRLAPLSETSKKTSEKPYVSVEMTVTDNGTGIPSDQLERIFDRFYQVDNSLSREHEGSGIGLSLTRELVELHNGTVTATSSPGQGSQFVVILPLELLHPAQSGQQLVSPQTLSSELSFIPGPVNNELVTLTEAEGNNPDMNPDAPLVLVVEDNTDLRNFISQSLSEHAVYRVLEASNGREGYQLAKEQIPDLVISDIMMPKMDGIEFCKLLKTDQNTSHIPVILLTAKASVESKLLGLETGADDYLIKPFDVRELLTRVGNLIAGRRQLRERYTRQVVLHPRSVAITSVDEDFLNRAMAIVEQYMADEQFSVEVFGKEIGMSRMQLYRKLQALTGHSPSDFIRIFRLQRAAQLLSANSGTVSQIADQVGFGSHSYFSRCFQEQFGKTPSAFVAELDRS